MVYRVSAARSARERIRDEARFIAKQLQMPETADRWLRRVYASIDTLGFSPQRYALAEESASLKYEVRRLIIGKYLALYTIDETKKKVHVVGFRHGAKLPRPHDLPTDPP